MFTLVKSITLEPARAEMDGLVRNMARAWPESNGGWGVAIEPLHELLSRGPRADMPVILGAAVFVLLIAGANVVSLQLGRGIVRRREVAMRAMLGTGPHPAPSPDGKPAACADGGGRRPVACGVVHTSPESSFIRRRNSQRRTAGSRCSHSALHVAAVAHEWSRIRRAAGDAVLSAGPGAGAKGGRADARSAPVAVVNEVFVRRFLAREEPIGNHVRIASIRT